MARKVRDKELGTRAARSGLKARGKPYYRSLEQKLHLGYRKLRGGTGKWVVRHYAGDQIYVVETIATADDLSDANGVDVLTFDQAQAKARSLRDNRSKATAGIVEPLTVADAMDRYLAYLETENKPSLDDTRKRDAAFIRPKLGDTKITSLTKKQLETWRDEIANSAPRRRTAKGEQQRYAKLGKDEESRRRRKVSANRCLIILKAALNKAWHDGDVPTDAAWRSVKPFKGVNAARIRYITVTEARRLLNACEPDFRKLVQAALETGARYGRLTRLTASDFNPDAGIVTINSTAANKKGAHIVLTKEGQDFFRDVCRGKRDDLLFRRADGTAWRRSNQQHLMKEACRRANIKPEISFHILRHTWASLAVMAGVPLLVVAKNLGHVDTRMVETHYGHLAPGFVADAIRKGAPRFGFKPDNKIASLDA